jgi:hypothetical protein
MLRLFTCQVFALDMAARAGLQKKSTRGIRSMDELRGILMALAPEYPQLAAMVIENPSYAPHLTVNIKNFLGIAESA